MPSDAFYAPLGAGRYASLPATAGPWSPDFQHGGPPTALLARSMVAAAGRPELHMPRISVELLGPVPVAEVAVEVTTVRPGRSVTLMEAVLSAGGRPVMMGRCWLVVPAPEEGRAAVHSLPDPDHRPPADDAAVPRVAAWPGAYEDGFVRALDWVPTDGSLGELGPGGAWARVNPTLVAGTATTPFERALTVADSGSGVGLSHDLAQVQAINVDLTVFFDRRPDGPWIHLDARTTGTEGGGSFTSSVLADRLGPFARGVQSLCVQRVGPAR